MRGSNIVNQKLLKRCFMWILVMSLVVVFFPMTSTAAGTKTTLDISYGSIVIGAGTVNGYDSSGNHITTPNPNGYIITGYTYTMEMNKQVSITGGTQNIVLKDLTIYNRYEYLSSAFNIKAGATAHITLDGTNTLVGYGTGMLVPEGATVYISGDATDTLNTSAIVGAGIGGRKGEFTTYQFRDSGTINICGGVITATGGNLSAGIGGGEYGYAGTINIYGGTVIANGGGAGIGGGYGNEGVVDKIKITGGSINGSLGITPVNAINRPLYKTTITLPTTEALAVDSLTIIQGSSPISYVNTGMKTGTNGELYLYLAANPYESMASVTAGGTTYSQFHGIVSSGSTNRLKIDQAPFSVNVNSTYTYGDTISPTISSGALSGPVLTYSGTDDVTGTSLSNSPTKPSNVGSYTIMAVLPGNDTYHTASASDTFTINSKKITNLTVGNINDQVYTGSAVVPHVNVRDNERNITLVSGDDYDVICENVNVGSATVHINGIGNYSESIAKTFNIIKKDITVSLSASPTTTKIGNDVTLTAEIKGAVTLPQGTITFKADDTSISSNVEIYENDGRYFAMATWSDVPAGSFDITAAYNADVNDNHNCTLNGIIESYSITKYNQNNFRIINGDGYAIIDDTISKIYGNAPFTLEVASKISEGAVVYSSSDTDVATVDSGGNVTLLKSGRVTLTAVSPTDDRYDEATSTVTLDVSKAEQSGFIITGSEEYDINDDTITKTYGNAPFTLEVASKLSEGAVVYSSSDTDVATVDSGGNVTLLKSGRVTLTAVSPTDDRYDEATSTVTLDVSKAEQSGFIITGSEEYDINDDTITKIYGDDLFTLQVEGKLSEGAVVYSSSDDGVATVDSGGNVTLLKSGRVTLTAVSPADDRYDEATATVTLDVSKAEQANFCITDSEGYTISDGAISKTYGNAPFILKVTGDLSLSEVTYSIESGSDVISVDEATGQVSLLKSGTAVISATSITDERYNQARSDITIQVIKANQSGFGFTESSINKIYGDKPFAVSATGGQSTGEVTYAVTHGEDIIYVDRTSGHVMINKSGRVVITATKETDDYYSSATSQLSINVEKADQQGFCFDKSIVKKTYEDAPFIISLSNKFSSNRVVYAMTDGSDVASVDGTSGQVTILKSGTAVITATSLTDDRYNQGTAQLTVHVSKADQMDFRFDQSVIRKTYGDKPFVIALSDGQSTGTVSYSVTDGNDVVKVHKSKGQVMLLKSGRAVITATKAGDDRYNETSSQLIVHVAKADQSGFGFAEPSMNKIYGDAAFTITASGGQSAGLVSYSVTGGNDVVKVDKSSGKVTMLKSGKAVITATKDGDDYYNDISSQLIVHVTKADQSGFGFAEPSMNKAYGDAAFTITASGGQSAGLVSYSVTGGNDVVKVNKSSGKITILKSGKAVINAIKGEDNCYNMADDTIIIYVDKALTSVIRPPSATNIPVIGALSASSLSGGEASVSGTFKWTNPSHIVSTTGTYEVTFIPKDSVNFATSTCDVNVKVTSIISNGDTGIEFNLSEADLKNSISSVSVALSMEPITDERKSIYSVVKDMVNADSQYDGNVLAIYDIKLLDQNGEDIETFSGKITVRIPIPEGMTGDLHVMWYDPVAKITTDMNARQEDGYLVFDTTHFSYYAIVKMTEIFSSSETFANQNVGEKTNLFVTIALISLIIACIIAVVVLKNKNRK